MQVSAQYAFSHFEDISSAIDRGEEVEIVRPGKPALQLVPRTSSAPPRQPKLKDGKRILGAGSSELRVPSVEEWKAMDEELERAMIDAPLMTSGEI